MRRRNTPRERIRDSRESRVSTYGLRISFMKAVVYYLKLVSTYCEMKAAVECNAELTVEGRNLATVAYKNDIGPRRRLGESSHLLSSRRSRRAMKPLSRFPC